jgi:hypothetical protein
MAFFQRLLCLGKALRGPLLFGLLSAGVIRQIVTALPAAAASTPSGPEIESAAYVSSGSGRSIDVTNRLKSQCLGVPGACTVSCNNQLAGDPEFGHRKYCRISYRCSGAKAQELQIQEGETRQLSCTSTMAGAEDPRKTPASVSPRTGTTSVQGAITGASTRSVNSSAVQVLGRSPFVEVPGEHVTFAMPLTDGGFIVATNVRGGASFIYKLSSDGAVVWRKISQQHGLVRSGGVSTDGGYWLGGDSEDGQSDLVQHIRSDGSLSARNRIASTATRRYLSCAVEQDGSYIQIGTDDTLDEYFRMQVPSISRTSAVGVRTWDKLIPFDQGHRVQQVPQQLLTCAGIFVTKDQHVIAAQQVLVMPDVRSADDIKREQAGTHLRPATLLVALDLNGKEINQLRHDDVVGGLLVATPNGAMLLESSYAKPGLQSVSMSDRRIHVYTFDSGLKETDSPLVIDDSDFDVAKTAFVTPRGGLLLAGCSGTKSYIFVRYISPQRSVTQPLSGTDLGYCGGSYWIGGSPHHNEALLLAESPNLGPYVARLTFSE